MIRFFYNHPSERRLDENNKSPRRNQAFKPTHGSSLYISAVQDGRSSLELNGGSMHSWDVVTSELTFTICLPMHDVSRPLRQDGRSAPISRSRCAN
jgi:hypothetical protein